MKKKYLDTALLSNSNFVTKISRELLIPALPALVTFYNISNKEAQYFVAIYFLGISFSRILWTFLSDKISKQKLIIFLHLLFILSSVICLYSSTYYSLLLGRFLQAFSIASVPLITRSLIYNDYDSKSTVKLYAYLSFFSGWTPAIATTMGAFFLNNYGLNSLFFVLLITGVFNTLLAFFLLNKRRFIENPLRNNFSFFKNYHFILFDENFWLVTLPFGFISSGAAIYLSLSAFLLVNENIFNIQTFGGSYFILVAGETCGKFVCGKLIDFFSSQTLILFAILIAFFTALLGLTSFFFTKNPWIFIGIVSLHYFADGMITIVSKEFICRLEKNNLTILLGLFTMTESLFAFLFCLIASFLIVSWATLFLLLLFISLISLYCRLRYTTTLISSRR